MSWLQRGTDFTGFTTTSVSSDGTIVAIGNTTDYGYVRVYQWDGATSWNQLGTDIVGEASGDKSGISISLSSDGTIVAIGARHNDENRGHVRVYRWDGVNSWNQLGSDIDGEASGDYSGISVGLSSDGTIVAIGANINGTSSGHVRVYQWNSSTTTWNQLGGDIDGGTGDEFGASIGLSYDGYTVVVGAYRNSDIATYNGKIQAYHFENGSWNTKGSAILGPNYKAWAGWNVSVSGDGNTLAFSAPISTPFVSVYRFVNNDWVQLGNNLTGDRKVSLSGDGNYVAVGESYSYLSATGRVQIYSYSNNAWTSIVSFVGDNTIDKFGEYLSLSSNGHSIIIGTHAGLYSRVYALNTTNNYTVFPNKSTQSLAQDTYYHTFYQVSQENPNTMITYTYDNSKNLIETFDVSFGPFSVSEALQILDQSGANPYVVGTNSTGTEFIPMNIGYFDIYNRLLTTSQHKGVMTKVNKTDLIVPTP